MSASQPVRLLVGLPVCVDSTGTLAEHAILMSRYLSTGRLIFVSIGLFDDLSVAKLLQDVVLQFS